MTISERRVAFGATLRNDIAAVKLDQTDVARMAGITRQQLNRILTGKSGTKPETVEALATAVQQSISRYMELAGYSSGTSMTPDVELQLILYSVPDDRRPALLDAVRVMAKALTA